VIENGTIRKLGYGFLFAFHTAISLAVAPQYTNVTDTQPAGHRIVALWSCIALQKPTVVVCCRPIVIKPPLATARAA